MRKLSLLVVVCAVAGMVACGGSGSNGGGNHGDSAISSIIVSCSPAAMRSGQTSQCTAQVIGTGNFNSAVTWAAGKGTISDTGLFTAQVVDTYTVVTITAISVQDVSRQGTTKVTVSSSIDGVAVSCSPSAIYTGDQSQCTAAVNGVGTVSQAVTWQAGFRAPIGGDCKCMSSNGVVTGPTVPGQGTVAVWATSVQDPSKEGFFDVNVTSPGTVTGVSVSCTLSKLIPGQDTLCTATVTGTGNFNPDVNWTSFTMAGRLYRNTGLYLANTQVSGSTSDTILATSSQDSSKVGSATVTVSPATGQPNNVVSLTVDAGPAGLTQADYNMPFTTVTVCVPGTSNCQTIDHVLVDTGSSGLRLLAAGLAGGQLNLPLPPDYSVSNGNPTYECATFVSGFLWGPIVNADILTLADGSGEQASNAFIQVVGQPGEAAVPSACQNAGTDASNLQALGANGILGVGSNPLDPCGYACYFTCGKGACVAAGLSDLINQPVGSFVQDNEGVVIQLPSVAPPGAINLSGTLIFGINTQSNNNLGSAQVLRGALSTAYQSVNYESTLYDTGSGGYYFLDSKILGAQMPTCSSKSGFYCPTSTQTFSVTNAGSSGGSSNVPFSVDNATTLFQYQTFTVFPTLGAEWPLTPPLFDFGLPFFFGRQVFVALPVPIQGTGLVGPFVAY
jgi:Protein of unknown function (DUF3443)